MRAPDGIRTVSTFIPSMLAVFEKAQLELEAVLPVQWAPPAKAVAAKLMRARARTDGTMYLRIAIPPRWANGPGGCRGVLRSLDESRTRPWDKLRHIWWLGCVH